MKAPETKNETVIDQLKEAVKKPFTKPQAVATEENVASKSACGKGASYCGALVKWN